MTFHAVEGEQTMGGSEPTEKGDIPIEVRVREQRLPHIGDRYDIQLHDGRQLVVVLQRDGHRAVGIVPSGRETPEMVAKLNHDEALAIAAILTGARFFIDRSEEDGIGA